MYIFKGGHRTGRHSPSWNAVCRKESSKRRQRPSAQHWGSPPTTSSQPLGVFRPGGEERGEDEEGQDQDAGSQEGSLSGGERGIQLPKPRLPPPSPLGSPDCSLLGQSQAVHPDAHCVPQKCSLLPWLNLLWARDTSDQSTD